MRGVRFGYGGIRGLGWNIGHFYDEVVNPDITSFVHASTDERMVSVWKGWRGEEHLLIAMVVVRGRVPMEDHRETTVEDI